MSVLLRIALLTVALAAAVYSMSGVLWVPDDYQSLTRIAALLLAPTVFVLALLRSRDRPISPLFGYACPLAAVAALVVYSGLDAVFVVDLDTNAHAGGGIVHAGEGPETGNPAFASGKALRVYSTSSVILERIANERKVQRDYGEVDFVKTDTSKYWDDVKAQEPLRVLGVTLSFCMVYLGFFLFASLSFAFLVDVTGVAFASGSERSTASSVPEHLDVFMCYSRSDQDLVEGIAKHLRGQGLSVWLDRWGAGGGAAWQERVQTALQRSRAAAVFRGPGSPGRWQRIEIGACISQAVHGTITAIPVLLPGGPGPDELQEFLKHFTAVDLREGITSGGLGQLANAIHAAAAPSSPG